MAKYTSFIPENVAVTGARRIGIYNARGNRVGHIPLGTLVPPTAQAKLYSFAALADVHMQYETAPGDFKKALEYISASDITFTCICGDLTTNGTATELTEYKNHVDAYAGGVPVYAIAGNHEGYNSGILSILQTYTGKPLYYSFSHGDDVFIMVGVKSNTYGSLFADGELTWLRDTLEANRNKRCFVFQHVFPLGGCGNALGLYTNGIWGGSEAAEFEAILRMYPNVIFFHGHSHLRFELQEDDAEANYDHHFGCHSVHIPSLASPREGNSSNTGWVNVFADSEGYIVDVYENGIHLRGRDFVKGEFLPIASYWLDTTL